MIHIEQYNTINDVPVAVWDKYVSREAVNLETAHLRAVEESRINNIQPFYFIAFHKNKPIGVAYCFLIQINFAELANSYPKEVLETVYAWKPDFMEVRIIEAGHIASLGSTIETTQPYTTDFLHLLSEKIEEIALRNNADLCLIRDISVQQYHNFQCLKNDGFKAVMGYPVARMPIRWNSIDGYIKSLKAKKRLNIVQKRSKLRAPGITVEIIEDYAPYAERLTELWTNVAKQNNGYAHEQLTPSFFESMARHLKGRSRILAIKRQGKVITYGLNLLGNTEFFGMAEGLDYSFRDEYDLYANNIFEAIQQACRLNKKTFNIGITAYDFKTSIGAELDASIYFIKSFKNHCYTSVYANFIRESIKQPDNFHRVFNDFDISNRIQLKEVEERLEIPSKNADPFSKHYNYTRANTARVTGLYTFFPVFESAQKPLVKNKNSEVIMLGTNAYLGLATHRKVKEAARKAIDKYGSGCSGSPALNGTLDLHQELSCELARFMQKQGALVFPSGYQTNVGAISALANRNDILVMDERNHASIVDGAILSRATIVRYKHINVESLEAVLKRNYNKPKLVITDSLFSMEGTIVDLPRIVELCKQYKARLMLDESHAIGVLGPNGKGVAEQYGLLNEVDIVMGTFSKSLASAGGFVAGDNEIIDALKHISRGHIFSASLPPPAVAGTLAALKIIESEPERRVQLLNNSRFMANGLNNLRFEVSYHGGAILSVFCGHELIAITAYKRLLEEGVFVNPVVSPAVPKNREILRLSVMATHKMEDLQRALNIFEKIKTQFWPEKI